MTTIDRLSAGAAAMTRRAQVSRLACAHAFAANRHRALAHALDLSGAPPEDVRVLDAWDAVDRHVAAAYRIGVTPTEARAWGLPSLGTPSALRYV